jgi:hypothetical protein
MSNLNMTGRIKATQNDDLNARSLDGERKAIVEARLEKHRQDFEAALRELDLKRQTFDQTIDDKIAKLQEQRQAIEDHIKLHEKQKQAIDDHVKMHEKQKQVVHDHISMREKQKQDYEETCMKTKAIWKSKYDEACSNLIKREQMKMKKPSGQKASPLFFPFASLGSVPFTMHSNPSPPRGQAKAQKGTKQPAAPRTGSRPFSLATPSNASSILQSTPSPVQVSAREPSQTVHIPPLLPALVQSDQPNDLVTVSSAACDVSSCQRQVMGPRESTSVAVDALMTLTTSAALSNDDNATLGDHSSLMPATSTMNARQLVAFRSNPRTSLAIHDHLEADSTGEEEGGSFGVVDTLPAGLSSAELQERNVLKKQRLDGPTQ